MSAFGQQPAACAEAKSGFLPPVPETSGHALLQPARPFQLHLEPASATLNAAFPGAISEKEIASLQPVSKCTPDNLMKQAKGRYTVVWFCGKKAALGMEVLVTDDGVTSVSTMEVFRRRAIQ